METYLVKDSIGANESNRITKKLKIRLLHPEKKDDLVSQPLTAAEMIATPSHVGRPIIRQSEDRPRKVKVSRDLYEKIEARKAREAAPAPAPAPVPTEKYDKFDKKVVMREFDKLWDKLNQSPTVRAVPGGVGMFWDDTYVLRGSGDMFDRYETQSSESSFLTGPLIRLVKSYSKIIERMTFDKNGDYVKKNSPYVLQEDYDKIKADVLSKFA